MSHVMPSRPPFRESSAGPVPETDPDLPVVAQYAITLALVAAAVVLAFVASRFVPAPALTLIFVLPVVVSGAMFGWRPSLAAIGVGVLAFDFFFTQPYWSLRISDPSEIWAAGLLFATAAVVSAVTWQSRQRAYQARRAAERADALRMLAHAIIEGPGTDIAPAAAAALGRIFAAPAVILADRDGGLAVAAQVGGAALSPKEIEAAQAAMTSRGPVRAETYPHEESRFDFWPVGTAEQCAYVVGVEFGRSPEERPADPGQFVDIVAAYLVSMPARAGR
jgi:K+-sensing histidine kinase KdpD